MSFRYSGKQIYIQSVPLISKRLCFCYVYTLEHTSRCLCIVELLIHNFTLVYQHRCASWDLYCLAECHKIDYHIYTCRLALQEVGNTWRFKIQWAFIYTGTNTAIVHDGIQHRVLNFIGISRTNTVPI